MVKKKGNHEHSDKYDRKKKKTMLRKRKNTIKRKVDILSLIGELDIYMAIQDNKTMKVEEI